ncbi:tetratricopeptide repeat protein [Actinomadura sp. 21ATH]|uniref:tetratricopeptide repeat protein n=1 Tax=Actinomadura sp. 21ATH TaxID=1735444 RepID=UPI0035C08C7D
MSTPAASRGDALVQRARMLLELRRPADSEREARAALVQDPNDPGAHILLALALALQGDTDGALESVDRGAALIPGEWPGHWAAGVVLTEAGRHREALGAFQNALACDAEQPVVYELLARNHYMLGEWQAAAGAAGQGLRLAPEDADLAHVMALALLELGDRAAAREHASRAVALAPESVDVHRTYGIVALATGDGDAAAHAFREAMRLDPGWEPGPALLLQALKQRNPLHRMDRWLRSLCAHSRRRVAVMLAGCLFVPWFLVMLALTLATWVNLAGQAVTTLLLNRDPRARDLLERAEVNAARLSAGISGTGAVLLVLAAALQSAPTLLAGAAVLALITPVQETPRLDGLPRELFAGFAGALAVLQAVLIPVSYALPDAGWPGVSILLTLYASLASTWLANLLHPRRPARN